MNLDEMRALQVDIVFKQEGLKNGAIKAIEDKLSRFFDTQPIFQLINGVSMRTAWGSKPYITQLTKSEGRIRANGVDLHGYHEDDLVRLFEQVENQMIQKPQFG